MDIKNFLVVTILLVSGQVNADIVTVPAGLDPGDEYRLVFITKDKIFTATSPNIGDYDAWVTSQADTQAALVALGTTWRVVGSTTSVSAKFHTDTDDSPAGPNGVPIYRLDGLRIADNYDDLWDGSIQSPLYVAQDGSILDTCCGTWTGTSTAGLAVPGSELGAMDLGVTDGAPNGTGENWIETAQFGANSQQFLYAISDVLRVPGGAIDVSIDIKPGSDPNSVNPKSKGVIPVAVLGSIDFDAIQVDFSTVTFGTDRSTPAHDGHVEDVNDDGFMDMMFHFRTQETGIVCGDSEATLTGELFDGTPISGTDTVNTVGCKGIAAKTSEDGAEATTSAGAMSWMLLLGLGVLGLWRLSRQTIRSS
jgi:hypothetical protein